MKSYADHLADCRTLLFPRAVTRVAVAGSLGLTLAENVVAAADSPTFASSAMDGYAVRVQDVPGSLAVVGEVAAGHVPDVPVAEGTAVRIMTGSAIPEGAEAVVPVEDTDERDGRVTVRVATTPQRHIRPAGDDVRAGDVVLRAGQVIAPAQLAALLTIGAATVSVHPAARVAVLSTGDELVEAGRTPGPAQLVDSNGPALAAAATAAGADVVHVGRLPDAPDALVEAIESLPACDLVVTSGGISMGAYDVVKSALAPLGLVFEQVAIQPGKPQGWGRFPGGPAFLGLPGNPVSALVSFELFGRAALGRERPTLRATLATRVARNAGDKRQFLRGRLDGDRVHVDGGPGSHLVAGLAAADCLLVVPEGAKVLEEGSPVSVIPL